jgi:hypothetical protein
MAKRNAILLICKHLCDKGVNPTEIASILSWRQVWYWVDGLVGADEFKTRAAAKAAATEATFDKRRWFCDERELCQADDKTYAFSNQWGGADWERAMRALSEGYLQFKIDFVPVA